MNEVSNRTDRPEIQSQSDSDETPQNSSKKTSDLRTDPQGTIQTPTTIEEFRSNLQKYFVTIQDSSDDEPRLYLGNGHNPVPISELDDLDDLYEITGTGWKSPTGEVPEISPMVEQIVSLGDWYMDPKNFFLEEGCPNYFSVSENYRVYESQDDFLREGTPKWIRIDNQIYRHFFYMTLGKFSGYQKNGEVTS